MFLVNFKYCDDMKWFFMYREVFYCFIGQKTASCIVLRKLHIMYVCPGIAVLAYCSLRLRTLQTTIFKGINITHCHNTPLGNGGKHQIHATSPPPPLMFSALGVNWAIIPFCQQLSRKLNSSREKKKPNCFPAQAYPVFCHHIKEISI